MIHGGRDPSVRAPATLDAIEALLDASRLEEAVARDLAESYRLLRTIEHRVQMINDAQTHLIPAQPEALDNVAQLHGLGGGPELIDLLGPKVDRAGAIFDSLSPDDRRQLSNDSKILHAELADLGVT
jgi:glutamate-ammonia-ligase adenylyltransferase